MNGAECSQVRLTTPNEKSTAFTFDEYHCLNMGIDAARNFVALGTRGLSPAFATARAKIETAQEALRRGECDPPAPAELAPAEEATLAQIEQEMRQQGMGASLALFLLCGLEDEESAQALLAMLRAQPAPEVRPSPLAIELAVRAGRVPFAEIPAYYRTAGRRSAYGSGFETGWRDQPFSNPYTAEYCRKAYQAGYQAGTDGSAAEIDRLLRGMAAPC